MEFKHNKLKKRALINFKKIIIIGIILLINLAYASYAEEWQWTQIGNLNLGDSLMDRDGNEVLIEKIERVYDEKGVKVYDLQVADTHYYFADGALVHNSDVKDSSTNRGGTNYQALPPNTKFSELKVGDLIGDEKITRIAKTGDALYFYIEKDGEEKVRYFAGNPNQEIQFSTEANLKFARPEGKEEPKPKKELSELLEKEQEIVSKYLNLKEKKKAEGEVKFDGEYLYCTSEKCDKIKANVDMISVMKNIDKSYKSHKKLEDKEIKAISREGGTPTLIGDESTGYQVKLSSTDKIGNKIETTEKLLDKEDKGKVEKTTITTEEEVKVEGETTKKTIDKVEITTEKIDNVDAIVRRDHDYDEKGDEIGFEEIATNPNTGEPLRYQTGKGTEVGAIATVKNGKVESADADAKSRLETERSQWTWRNRFYMLERLLTDFHGLGYIATLFRDEEFFFEWREGVDKAFANLYLGTEYWESAICASHVDRDQEGVAYLDTRLGLAGVAAHIEATRSQAIILPEGAESGDFAAGLNGSDELTAGQTQEFLYKITFNVRNGDWDRDPKSIQELKFNIFLIGESRANLFEKEIVLERGEAFGAPIQEPIVQFSNVKYDRICIKFDEVPYFWSLDENSLCNKIIQAPEEPLEIEDAKEKESEQKAKEGEKGGKVLDI